MWGFNDHAYLAVATPSPISWPNAKLAAEGRGGYLATLTSIEENAFAYAIVRDRPELFDTLDRGPWIGGRKTHKDAGNLFGWTWVTGEPWTFANWGPSQPDNYGMMEEFVHFYPQPTHELPSWNDSALSDTYVNGYVVEFD